MLSKDMATLLEQINRSGMAAATTFAVHSPIDGSLVATVPDCGVDQAWQALAQAEQAFDLWKRTTAYERSGLLRRWHALIAHNESVLARLMTLEMGKPITESVSEIRYGNSMIEWNAEEAKRIGGESFPSQFLDKRLTTLRQPSGIVYAITPWNFPVSMVTRKVAPALAAGCTVILKPAEQTPLSALALAALWAEAGGPPGTFQVLTAADPRPASQVMLDDMRVRVLTFTGSTTVGMALYQHSARTMKRISLELGGHAPFLIFADADVDRAVAEVLASKFRNGGQTCVCANRIYVQQPVAAEFTARFTEAVRSMQVGDPLDNATQIGPVVDERALEKIKYHVHDAIAKGAQVVTGGKPLTGLYYQPTVLTGITPDMVLLHEETFGPVAPIIAFTTEDEAIRMANASDYGLAAYVWTNDINRAYLVTEELAYGVVGINDGVPSTAQAPFGGVKLSGIGREGGHWGIEEFLDIKYVSLKLKTPAR